MNYNDYTILTDAEYAKIASNYNNTKSSTQNELLTETYTILQKCKSCIYLSHSLKNFKLLKELNNHINILNKLEENFLLHLNVKEEKINNLSEFNLFNYLSFLFELNTNLNNLLNYDLQTLNKLLIKPFIKDTENLILSLLKLLSKLNIHIFKFM